VDEAHSFGAGRIDVSYLFGIILNAALDCGLELVNHQDQKREGSRNYGTTDPFPDIAEDGDFVGSSSEYSSQLKSESKDERTHLSKVGGRERRIEHFALFFVLFVHAKCASMMVLLYQMPQAFG
jgi:hypothetical protein